MILCLEKWERYSRQHALGPPKRVFSTLGCCLTLLVALSGCAGIHPVGARPDPEPPLAAISAMPKPEPHPTIKWSTHTRDGRTALIERELMTAEAHFQAALDASFSFRSRDIRIDVSFGNLVRVASIYARIARPDDAERILTGLENAGARRRLASQRIEAYRSDYAILVASPLGPSFTPLIPKPANQSARYDRLIRNAADSFDVDPDLVKAVVRAESNFKPRAVSRVGAQGLMQLMPATARAMGVRRPFAPKENLRGGVRYLRTLLDRFDQIDLALAAYNAGPEAVHRYGGIPPYPETQDYVTKVLSHYRRYQRDLSR
jgi:soluble lytic murein transglycosylase-like protein